MQKNLPYIIIAFGVASLVAILSFLDLYDNFLYLLIRSIIEEKEVRILNLTKNNADKELINALQEEVSILRDKIRSLEITIAQQKQELEELRTLRELYDENVKSNVELSKARRIEFLETHIPEDKDKEYDKLLENFTKSDESDLNKMSEELKLMEMLSKPQYKIKDKN